MLILLAQHCCVPGPYGRGCGVGLALGVGTILGVVVGVALGEGDGVAFFRKPSHVFQETRKPALFPQREKMQMRKDAARLKRADSTKQSGKRISFPSWQITIAKTIFEEWP